MNKLILNDLKETNDLDELVANYVKLKNINLKSLLHGKDADGVYLFDLDHTVYSKSLDSLMLMYNASIVKKSDKKSCIDLDQNWKDEYPGMIKMIVIDGDKSIDNWKVWIHDKLKYARIKLERYLVDHCAKRNTMRLQCIYDIKLLLTKKESTVKDLKEKIINNYPKKIEKTITKIEKDLFDKFDVKLQKNIKNHIKIDKKYEISLDFETKEELSERLNVVLNKIKKL